MWIVWKKKCIHSAKKKFMGFWKLYLQFQGTVSQYFWLFMPNYSLIFARFRREIRACQKLHGIHDTTQLLLRLFLFFILYKETVSRFLLTPIPRYQDNTAPCSVTNYVASLTPRSFCYDTTGYVFFKIMISASFERDN